LGLSQINNAVFLISDPDTEKSLIQIQDYIAFGYPTKAVVTTLLKKRGFIKSKEGKRVPISDNNIIEDLLGSHDIICLEDIIAALAKCGKNPEAFKAAKNVLWPI